MVLDSVRLGLPSDVIDGNGLSVPATIEMSSIPNVCRIVFSVCIVGASSFAEELVY